jgi:hypothetical protein
VRGWRQCCGLLKTLHFCEAVLSDWGESVDFLQVLHYRRHAERLGEDASPPDVMADPAFNEVSGSVAVQPRSMMTDRPSQLSGSVFEAPVEALGRAIKDWLRSLVEVRAPRACVHMFVRGRASPLRAGRVRRLRGAHRRLPQELALGAALRACGGAPWCDLRAAPSLSRASGVTVSVVLAVDGMAMEELSGSFCQPLTTLKAQVRGGPADRPGHGLSAVRASQVLLATGQLGSGTLLHQFWTRVAAGLSKLLFQEVRWLFLVAVPPARDPPARAAHHGPRVQRALGATAGRGL